MKYFKEDVKSLKRDLEKGIVISDILIKTKNPDTIIDQSIELAFISEKIVNSARLLPRISGVKIHEEIVEKNFLEFLDVKIDKNEKGWYILDIPALLPKKEKGNASYIRASVFTALKERFKDGSNVKMNGKTVLIFNHVYSPKRHWRYKRDHDNIEINVIVDAVALFLLEDDSPDYCNHYYMSSEGENDRTIITLLPEDDFIQFLKG